MFTGSQDARGLASLLFGLWQKTTLLMMRFSGIEVLFRTRLFSLLPVLR